MEKILRGRTRAQVQVVQVCLTVNKNSVLESEWFGNYVTKEWEIL